MQTRQNVEKIAKCSDLFSDVRGNAKLMINFLGFISNRINVQIGKNDFIAIS